MTDWRDDSDEWSDENAWDEDWPEDDDELESLVVPCPACGADIYEDAVRCPICGEYVNRSHSVWEQKPWWWIVLGLVGIGAVIVVLSI